MDGNGPIRVLAFTWNVGNSEPKAEELNEWIPQKPAFDLVVVGVQVMRDPTPQRHL
jgi:hypothetical protein